MIYSTSFIECSFDSIVYRGYISVPSFSGYYFTKYRLQLGSSLPYNIESVFFHFSKNLNEL